MWVRRNGSTCGVLLSPPALHSSSRPEVQLKVGWMGNAQTIFYYSMTGKNYKSSVGFERDS